MSKIVTSVGYPAAGKSVVADWMNNNGIPVVSMGDRLRERFKQVNEDTLKKEFNSNDKSSLLGKWATKQREIYGQQIIAEWTYEYIDNNINSDIIFIDGLRSKAELDVFQNNFEDVNVILIQAKRQERLKRIQERGREGESEFTIDDLIERDKREESWGLKEVTEEADYIIHNNDSLEEFQDKIDLTIQKIRDKY
jgi:dephospho-CoA kinase